MSEVASGYIILDNVRRFNVNQSDQLQNTLLSSLLWDRLGLYISQDESAFTRLPHYDTVEADYVPR